MGKQVKCVECDVSMDWAIPKAEYIKEHPEVLQTCKNSVVCGQTMKTKSVDHVQQCRHFEPLTRNRRERYLKEVEEREQEVKQLAEIWKE